MNGRFAFRSVPMNLRFTFHSVLAVLVAMLVFWAAPVYSQDIGPVGLVAIDPQTPTTLYATTQHGIWKSVDGGGLEPHRPT